MMLKVAKFMVTVVAGVAKAAWSGLKIAVFSKPPPDLISLRPPAANECVILGNGPSLKESLADHPDFLTGKESLCTNDFVDSEYFEKIRPRYYLFTDPTFWSPQASERFKRVFAGYVEKLKRVDWPMVIFMPMAAKSSSYFRDLPQYNSHIQCCYFNTTEVDCWRPLRFWLYRKNLAVPPMQNVIVAGIFLTLNMGFQVTYVLGGDHSWHESLQVDDQNRLFITNTRFQDKEQSTKSPFFENPGESEPYNMYRLFSAFSRMYLGYMELEAYAKAIGAKIYNTSKRSYIDAFERLNLDQKQ